MDAPINFYTADIARPTLPDGLLSWLLSSVALEGYGVDSWGVIFCSDEHVLELNKTHLNHDTYTDILTFDYRADPLNKALVGESYISYPRVCANAQAYGLAREEELCRVILHGMLHVCGYGDSTEVERASMRAAEDKHLALRPSADVSRETSALG